MKHNLNSLYLFATRMDRQHIQLLLLVISLVFLVIGSGAPVGGGDGHP